MAPAGNGASASLECPECGQSFRRREHLSRHLDRHSGARSYTCSICKRTFPRRDTLKRHVSTHGAAALTEWEHANKEPRDHRRACEACAKGKQRCDGNALDSSPCSKCVDRGRHCVYPVSPASGRNVDGESEIIDSYSPDAPLQVDEPSQIDVMQPAIAANDPINCHGGQDFMQHNSLEQTATLPTGVDAFPTDLDFELPWDDFLVSPQFLFPFSPPCSHGAENTEHMHFATMATPLSQQESHRNCALNSTLSVNGRPLQALHDSGSMTAEEEDILVAEYVPHVPPLGTESRAYIIDMLGAHLHSTQTKDLGRDFPSLRHLDTYLQLYFEHFHARMPILHIPTFQASPEAWLLVLAIVSIGCNYSNASLKSGHRVLLQSLAQQIQKEDITQFRDIDILTRAQTWLLFQQICLSIGHRQALVEVQLYRNVSVTLCRQLISQDGNPLHSRVVSENPSHTWLQWTKREAKRRVVYFTWLSECYQSVFFMLPPLLSIHELQIALPSAEPFWDSSYDQWQCLPTASSNPSICAALAQFGVEGTVQASLEQPARMVALFSAFGQHTASQDLIRAMMPCSGTANAQPCPDTIDPKANIWRTAFEALSQSGSSQSTSQREGDTKSNDFAVAARLLTILSFTPTRLLFLYSKWQTSEHGYLDARKELLNLLNNDVSRARYCLYESAQLFRHFRTTEISIYVDVLALLMCVLYIVSYIELVELQRLGAERDTAGTAEIIRLDQATREDDRDDWLSLRSHAKPHITGLGLLNRDRSVARVFKEASRIMEKNGAASRLAAAMSVVFASSATGRSPDFPDGQ